MLIYFMAIAYFYSIDKYLDDYPPPPHTNSSNGSKYYD